MAKTKTPTLAGPDAKWQAEDDQRTLTRAAEIVADKVRLRSAMGHLQKTSAGMTRMVDLLATKAAGK